MKKRALTLAETLISLLIIAILVTIMMPVLNKAKPDENELMHKKATFIVERVVNELVTDEFLYPNNSEMTGFGNISPVTVNGQTHSGDTKFCTLFASRINKAAGTGVNCAPGKKSVTSVEGIDWYLPIASFEGAQTIMVDVNGDKRPNCTYNASTCKRPDRFLYQVKSGVRMPVKEIGDLGPTQAPGARPAMPGEPAGNNNDPRTAQKWYSITCRVYGSGTVFGVGSNKPNGHYQLVAIPSLGYKGDWFTKNVTVNNADVTDCAVTFTPFSCAIPGACPTPDGATVTPENPQLPPEEKTYCINVTMTGDKDQCAYAGAGCKKSAGKYIVTASGKEGYKPSWTETPVTIVNKDVNLTLDCVKDDEPEKCFSITPTGDIENCPVTLPAGTCKADNKKFTKGTYNYTVTPNAGFTFGEAPDISAEAVSKQIIIEDKDEEIPIKCNVAAPLPPVVDIYVEDTFDGLWQEPLNSNYYHVYVKNYFYNRTLKVDVPNVYVKMKITGKYVGENNYGGSLSLNESGIDSKFKQSLTQELANNATVRWQSFQELGNGGGVGSSKQIRSVWEKYTLTINDQVLAENKALSSSNAVDEYKIGDTTFKIHFVDAPRYMAIVKTSINYEIADIYNSHGYAWVTAKTNVVNLAAGGGHAGMSGTSYYTYFEPYGSHIVHKGDTVYLTGYSPYTDYNDSSSIVYPTDMTYNGSLICSAPDFQNGGNFDCYHSFTGGYSYPNVNEFQINHKKCKKDEYKRNCCSGGWPCFPYLQN